MDREFDMPWIVGLIYHRYGIKTPCIGSSLYHGKGEVKIPLVGGLIYHGWFKLMNILLQS
jgi:hypothetical protein